MKTTPETIKQGTESGYKAKLIQQKKVNSTSFSPINEKVISTKSYNVNEIPLTQKVVPSTRLAQNIVNDHSFANMHSSNSTNEINSKFRSRIKFEAPVTTQLYSARDDHKYSKEAIVFGKVPNDTSNTLVVAQSAKNFARVHSLVNKNSIGFEPCSVLGGNTNTYALDAEKSTVSNLNGNSSVSWNERRVSGNNCARRTNFNTIIKNLNSEISTVSSVKDQYGSKQRKLVDL